MPSISSPISQELLLFWLLRVVYNTMDQLNFAERCLDHIAPYVTWGRDLRHKELIIYVLLVRGGLRDQ